MYLRFLLCTLAATLCVLFSSVHAQAIAPGVDSFSPQGEVRSVQQVAVRFSQDMVALGKADAPAPVQLQCDGAPPVSTRWLDTRRWVAEFTATLPVGTRCTARLRTDLRALSGAAVVPAGPWAFHTGGPKVSWQQPYNGYQVVEQQVFLLYADAPLARDTLAGALRCQIKGQEGQEEEHPVTVLDAAATRAHWIKVRSADDFVPEHTVALRCAQALPVDATVQLLWGRSIATPSGVASGSDQTLGPWRVRPAFAAKVVCAQIAGTTGCDPRQNLRVEFTERVKTEALRGASLHDAQGKAYPLLPQSHFEAGSTRTLVTQLQRNGGQELLPEGATLSLRLPEALQDVDGRRLSNLREFPKALPMATLPPYLGFVEAPGVLPWAGDRSLHWPLAVRRLEPAVAVQVMRLGGAMRDPAASGSALQRRAQASRQALALWHSAQDWPQRSPGAQGIAQGMYPVLARQQLDWAQLETRTVEGSAVEALHFVPVKLTQPGLYLLEAHSPRFSEHLRAALAASDAAPPAGLEPRAALLQISNLNLSVRLSAQGDSLLWATAIDTGLPLGGVEVDWLNCRGEVLAQGSTDAQGLMPISASATRSAATQSCQGASGAGHFGLAVVARKGDDLAVLGDIGSGHAYRYGFDSYSRTSSLGHTVFDRTLFKAGETVSMQHLQRLPTAEGFAFPPEGSGKVELRFQDGGLVATLPVQWDATGSATSQWHIPETAKLGRYTASVTGSDGRAHQASFQVEEFRTPVFEAALTGSAQWSAGQQRLPLALRLSYLAGGAAAGEPVSVAGQYVAGATAPVPGYVFSDATLPDWQAPAFTTLATRLDVQGQAQLDPALPVFDRPVTLNAEMKFSDPNGEVQTVGQSFALWSGPIRLGIRATPQSKVGQSRTSVRLQAVVLDAHNQPLIQKPLTLTARPVRWDSHRSRSKSIEWLGPVRTVCQQDSDERGQIACDWADMPEKEDADWLFAVSAQESSTTSITSSQVVYRYQLRWAPSAAVLALAPGQTQPLAAGAPAQLHIQAPFFPATVLLSVEREGVLQASTHRLTQASSQIELPLQAHFAPNVRIAARFVRGLNDVPTASADAAPVLTAEHQLAVKIAPDRFALDVRVQTDATHTRIAPGGTAQVQVTVRQRQGGKAAAGARVTLVAVDEALLALKGNPSWNVLDAMLRERFIAVSGSALDRWLRHKLRFGPQPAYWPPDDMARASEAPAALFKAEQDGANAPMKAARMAAAPAPAPAMMAGAASADLDAAKESAPDGNRTRSNFGSLVLWRTDVVLDAQGTARVPVTFNDSLTRWRIVALAVDGADRFGHGQTSVEVSQALQLYSGLPPLLRSGDRLTQQVTVRNTGNAPLHLEFSAVARMQRSQDASPPAVCDTSSRQNSCAAATAEQDAVARGLRVQRSLKLLPGQAQDVAWPVAVPEGVERLDWDIEARSAAPRERDHLQLSQRVVAALPVTVRQSTLLQIKGEASLPVSRPSDAQPDQGGVQVALSDSLVRTALQQVRHWMADYPFACLEQKASKLVAAGDAAGWNRLMQELPKYLDQNGLARYFNESTLTGSEVLTAYLLDVAQATGWAIPEAARQKMLAGVQRAWTQADPLDWQPWRTPISHTARQLALQATLASQGHLRSMEALRFHPQDLNPLPTLALVDWARTLLALPPTPDSAVALQQAAMQLRSRYDVQGTRLNWRSDDRDHWWWWMWNGDVAMARSVALIQQWQQRDASWQADLPLLIQGLIGRQQQGRWSTTVANVWGTLALQTFATSTEAGPVTGTTTLALAPSGGAPATLSVNWPQPPITLLRQDAKQSNKQSDTRLQLVHQGSGAPWANVSITAAVRLQQPYHAGMQVEKTITPVEQKQPGQWSVGDVVRVTLKLQSQAELTWVAVLDPIPSGATILGRGLGRESQLAQQGQGSSGGAWPSYIERAHDSYRAYYRWVPRGTWSIDYSVRLNNAGTFELPATRTEALYAPEIFGENPNPVWVVKAAGEK